MSQICFSQEKVEQGSMFNMDSAVKYLLYCLVNLEPGAPLKQSLISAKNEIQYVNIIQLREILVISEMYLAGRLA